MKFQISYFVNVLLGVILGVSVAANLTGAVDYDPWLDVNDDGYGGIDDIVSVAEHFGASGDPTKHVIVDGYNWTIQSYNLNIPAGSVEQLEIPVAGIKEVTLGFESTLLTEVNTGFDIGIRHAYVDEFNVSEAATPLPNAMWIEPFEISLNAQTHVIGYKFNVTVWINLQTNCMGWQFKMLYNTTLINATRAGYTFDSEYKSDFFKDMPVTLPLSPIIGGYYNVTHSYVAHGEALIVPPPPRDPGHGSLSWVEFEVMSHPAEGQTFENIIDISTSHPDKTNAYLWNGTSYEEIPLNVYDCSYTITYDIPVARWQLINYQAVRTYTVTGPVLTIKCYNPNIHETSLTIDVYTTA